MDGINKDEVLKNLIFPMKNVTKTNGFIRFSIKGISQNIHFELYVMDFKKELETEILDICPYCKGIKEKGDKENLSFNLINKKCNNYKCKMYDKKIGFIKYSSLKKVNLIKSYFSKMKKISNYKKLSKILKLGTNKEYLQLQLHFEDIDNNIKNQLIKNFEKKYLSNYNVIPHNWELPKLKAFQNEKTNNIGYILESKITRKDILLSEKKSDLHINFYDDGFTRKAIFKIFRKTIFSKKFDILNASYINFYDLSRNDIKVMAENYLQDISYYLKNENFIDDLKEIVNTNKK